MSFLFFILFFTFVYAFIILLLFLYQLEGGISHLPLLDPTMRATPLSPSEWRKRLKAVREIDETTNSSHDSNYVLLDVRNGIHFPSYKLLLGYS